jgi:hypothetical protein
VRLLGLSDVSAVTQWTDVEDVYTIVVLWCADALLARWTKWTRWKKRAREQLVEKVAVWVNETG